MLLATVIALLMLFLGTAGSDVDAWMKVFWVPWPIGGVLCGVVGIIVPLVRRPGGGKPTNSVRFCRIGHAGWAAGRLESVNTDQKLPAESAGERPSTPLFGHAISHAATLIGLFAIVLWGFMAGLVRLVSESFGATLGSALIYTVGGMLLLIVRLAETD